jgi:hypothetical protein
MTGGRKPGFDPGSVHVEFVVDKVPLAQVSVPSTSAFPCQYHSAMLRTYYSIYNVTARPAAEFWNTLLGAGIRQQV